MSRRAFLKSLTALVGGLTLPVAAHASIHGGAWKALQISPLAGFPYRCSFSQLLDRGEMLEATIAELGNSGNSWDRIRVEVRWRV